MCLAVSVALGEIVSLFTCMVASERGGLDGEAKRRFPRRSVVIPRARMMAMSALEPQCPHHVDFRSTINSWLSGSLSSLITRPPELVDLGRSQPSPGTHPT